ncbi:alkaline phosphatase family protein [Chryseobacterium arthrosphaerae]|uniref:LTA synthase family protein n=1 Tax=Chryseobacterium arthrosphaerae TaxID=651561 RepID=UPI000F51195E|nr:alkaline phosphatase family protein [Chryseobacterium arthrosphaerae]AYZ13534.1 alkaline phosphatase family protein [Chryseobacterium arthrosphaerae]MDG4651070.1 sulfatase-like hydrolase/transferase [Chryseobacterium arthrosphaerae]
MKFLKGFRKQEVLALLYRIFLAYVFYQIARLLFWYFNKDLIKVDSVSEYIKLAYHGTAFDTTAILYVNSLFILLSLVPLVINTKKGYQKVLFWVYFITNGLAYAMNFGDFIYYKFSQARLTSAVFQVAEHESNVSQTLMISIGQHPFVLIWYVVLMIIWVFLYKKVKIREEKPANLLPYFLYSVLTLCITTVLVVGGIRGDFKHSTRPINMVDATRFVTNPLQGNMVLNSTFSFFRTLNTNNFKEVHFVDEKYITENVQPYKVYDRKVENRPNIVIFIVESFGREYSGAFNKDKNIKDYVSYTPFIDSLAGQSLIFPNTFANGRQSIHGMSSVLAGIPSLTDAFTGSPYSNQKIQSIVSVCNDLGYDTSFYHGAPNGSMGFLGFGNILGFKHYFGKTEYNHDEDFDGMWAIWDEPFLQYFAKNVGKKQPFMTTVFTASSHHPFKIPAKYNGKFKKGKIEMHEPIQYTDYAIKKYFETAKKQPWFNNTIFVFTGDHTNQVYYSEYERAMNRYAVPLIFYSPNPAYQLKGVNPEIAQQADIYPTLADLIGYNKPIRSWGRSLVSDKKYPFIVVNSDGSTEQFMIGNYIYRFDGKEIIGVYDQSDLSMEKNLIGQLKTPEVEQGKLTAKAWYQDYMDRVINRKLY